MKKYSAPAVQYLLFLLLPFCSAAYPGAASPSNDRRRRAGSGERAVFRLWWGNPDLLRVAKKVFWASDYILILMLKLELPQVMQPRSEAPNAGVRALYVVPAHVGPLGLFLHPPILFPDARRSSVEIKLIQARVIV